MADDPHASPSQQPQPRPGSQGSHPSASHYVVELPYPEELQVMLEGRYSVEAFLGRGGMGAVYRGSQLPLRRPVAIKILQKKQEGVGDDYDFEERFKREAYAMAALTHPHIVQVYDCGDAGEHFLFISMELVEGGDLSDALKGGAITPDMALKLIPQICDGLQAAHERGIVHRDIKPANIFLTKEGRAKVADFGLAKKFDTKSTFMTKTGLGMGTPDYAAPEQYDGIADIDHRADIYSLGVMMYQMLTGKLPRGTTFKSPSQLVPVPPGVDAIVSRAMASEREERYQSVAEIKAELARLTPKSTNTNTMAVPVAVPVDATGTAPVATARPATSPRPATQTRPVAPAPAAVQRPTGRTAATVTTTKTPAPAKKTSTLVPVGIVLALAVIASAWFMLHGGKATLGGNSPAADESKVPWTNVELASLAAPDDGKRIRRMENGLLYVQGPPVGFSKAPMSDSAIRAVVVVKEANKNFQLKMRSGKDQSCGLRVGRENAVLYQQTAKGETKDLLRVTFAKPLDADSEVMVEIAAIATTLYARVNGQFIGKVETQATKGTCTIAGFGGTWVKRLQFINFDGVDDPLRTLGWDVRKVLPP